jgi:EAL domain-containing protein (putative c-di-GMP-specific phosphodiesterase class I)
VLETACEQLKCWEVDDLTKNLVISVNVSAKQFHQGDFVQQVSSIIKKHGADPKLLKLELTESMLINNIDSIINTMSQLSDLGVQLSLDDFGTGYSSLQYLKRLPLHQLKIDQSFIHDLADSDSDKAIVRTIIALAKGLKLDVIAEGVETEDQRKFLIEAGCTHFQGYLFSRPVSIENLKRLLA